MQRRKPPEPSPTLRSEACSTPSKRSRIQQVVWANPYLSPLQICKILDLDYEENSKYVRKEKCIAKRYSGTVTAHDTHRNKVVWNIPEWNSQRERLICQPEHGWSFSQRNKLLYFRDEKGSILWHNTNKIELFLRGTFNLGCVKELFCRAFDQFITDWIRINLILDKGELTERHHTFRLGELLPRFHIAYFSDSHGLTIYSDGSHCDAIEVNETKPFWFDKLRQIGEGFEKNMASHMSLLNEMAKMQRELANSRPLSARLFEALRKRLARQRILHGIVSRVHRNEGKPREGESET